MSTTGLCSQLCPLRWSSTCLEKVLWKTGSRELMLELKLLLGMGCINCSVRDKAMCEGKACVLLLGCDTKERTRASSYLVHWCWFVQTEVTHRDAKKHVFFKPCFLCKKKSVFYRKKQFFNVFFVFFNYRKIFN